MSPRLRGGTARQIQSALDAGIPLPGTAGFAGELPDGSGTLVRDVLGRQPLYVDGDDWAFAPENLSYPEPFPAGHARRGGQTERIWPLPAPQTLPERVAGTRLRRALRHTLSFDDLGLPTAFSGGVDSTVVGSAASGPLYVGGFPDGRDVPAAIEAAEEMDRAGDLHVVEFDPETLAAAVPEVAAAIGRTNAMDVAIALPLYLVGREAARDGFDRLAVGQGADELFGGYDKVAKAPSDTRVEADSVRNARREVMATLPDQLERDTRALRAAGVEPVAPLLHDRIVDAALRLPAGLLVDGEDRKVGFRQAARPLVPESVAAREKVAIQYGSLTARELDRLARQAGFKRRMENHVARYVESRLSGE
jgi:asparagine synthase (glutamine-hydrolysing)